MSTLREIMLRSAGVPARDAATVLFGDPLNATVDVVGTLSYDGGGPAPETCALSFQVASDGIAELHEGILSIIRELGPHKTSWDFKRSDRVEKKKSRRVALLGFGATMTKEESFTTTDGYSGSCTVPARIHSEKDCRYEFAYGAMPKCFQRFVDERFAQIVDCARQLVTGKSDDIEIPPPPNMKLTLQYTVPYAGRNQVSDFTVEVAFYPVHELAPCMTRREAFMMCYGVPFALGPKPMLEDIERVVTAKNEAAMNTWRLWERVKIAREFAPPIRLHLIGKRASGKTSFVWGLVSAVERKYVDPRHDFQVRRMPPHDDDDVADGGTQSHTNTAIAIGPHSLEISDVRGGEPLVGYDPGNKLHSCVLVARCKDLRGGEDGTTPAEAFAKLAGNYPIKTVIVTCTDEVFASELPSTTPLPERLEQFEKSDAWDKASEWCYEYEQTVLTDRGILVVPVDLPLLWEGPEFHDPRDFSYPQSMHRLHERCAMALMACLRGVFEAVNGNSNSGGIVVAM